MKRTEQAASRAKASKRCSARGSRSIAISVPVAPRRSASRRAWPPSPNVQSTATAPCNSMPEASTTSSSSLASTGTCPTPPQARRPAGSSAPRPAPARTGGRARGRRRCISSVGDTRGDLLDAAQQRRLMLVPALPAPQLHTVADPHHDHVLLQLGVIAEEARDHDPAGGIEVRLLGVAVEEPLELGPAL